MTSPAPPTVGFIGLGIMGRPMAANLLKAGFPLVAHNRSHAPVEALAALGARRAHSPAEVAAHSDIVITMLPATADVQTVVAGPGGVLEGARPQAVIVDMSTILPAAARELAAQAAAQGIAFLDAPVSGGEVGAKAATLSIMVGGEAAALERARPVLAALGSRIVYMGGPGAGQVCKVCNQAVIGATMVALGEAFALARKAGVEPARVREALLGGFAASRVLELHGQRVIEGNYVAGGPVRHYQKDAQIIMDTARELAVPALVMAVVQQMVNATLAAGRGDDDYASVIAQVMALAGVEA
jgi:2-hydroxy-3-oxopropionate reductase